MGEDIMAETLTVNKLTINFLGSNATQAKSTFQNIYDRSATFRTEISLTSTYYKNVYVGDSLQSLESAPNYTNFRIDRDDRGRFMAETAPAFGRSGGPDAWYMVVKTEQYQIISENKTYISTYETSLAHEFMHPRMIYTNLANSGVAYSGNDELNAQIREQKIAAELGYKIGIDFPDILEAGTGYLVKKNTPGALPYAGPQCFLAGTPILMADGTQKPIEQIKPGDLVMAFDPAADSGRGARVPRPVTQTFTNDTRQVVDLRGLRCTPGHVFLTGETDTHGRGVFKTIAAILKEDGTLVDKDGHVVRARTGAPLGSVEDTLVHVAYRDPETGAERVALVRAGVPAITVHRLPEVGSWKQQRWSLAQWSAKHGIDVLLDGTLRAADGALYGASDWPQGSTPFDDHDARNWVVRTADGHAYTPPWIADLIETDEHAGLKLVGEGAPSHGRHSRSDR